MISWLRSMMCGVAALAALPALAQDRDPADRADPAVIERDLRDQQPRPGRSSEGGIRAPRASQAAPEAIGLRVQAIRVTGAAELPASAFAPVAARYVNRPLDQADLVRLATEVANVARAAGFGLATAWVPAQDTADGVLVVEIEEGRIHTVRASGPGSQHAERMLAAVAGGRAVRTVQLERRLLLAADVPGLWVGDARMVRENGRNVLVVNTRFDRISGRAEVDNRGSDTVGPARARLGLNVNSLLVGGDQLSIGAATTPLDPRELQLAEAQYSLPLGRSGTQVGIGGYLGHTRSGGHLWDRDIEGNSSEVQIDVTHPVVRTRAQSHWLGARLSVRDSELTEAGALVRDDRIVSATAWLFSNMQFAGGKLRSRVSVVRGLDLLGATRRGDPDASRSNAGGEFTKVEYWADYLRPLGGGFSVELATRGQLADRPLLSSEEMGLGGQQFLRAFDYREASGDQGAAGSVELRFDLDDLPAALRRTQIYAYADGGRVHDLQSTRRPEGLASAGLGLRVHLRGGFRASGEVGMPLTDSSYDADPEPRFSFSIGKSF